MRSLIAVTTGILLSFAFSNADAQRQSQPFAPPEGAQEMGAERIPDMPDDFTIDEEELRKVAGTAIDIFEAMNEGREQHRELFHDSGLDSSQVQAVRRAMENENRDMPDGMSAEERDDYKQAAKRLEKIESSTIAQMNQAPANNGMERDRYNMIIAHLQEEHPEDFQRAREIIQEKAEQRGLDL